MMSRMSTATSNPEITANLIKDRIAHINWFHQMDLGRGVTTPGDCNSQQKFTGLHLPEDLRGKTFLDIGSGPGLRCSRDGWQYMRGVNPGSLFARGRIQSKAKDPRLLAGSFPHALLFHESGEHRI